MLRGFGVSRLPLWPITAIGYCALSLGFVAAIRDEPNRARLLWMIPLAIATIVLIENIGKFDLGVDRLLFAQSIADYGVAHPGRSGATSTTAFFLLAGAGCFAVSQRWRRDEAASMIASTVLGTAFAASVLTLFALPDDPFSRLYHFSLPSAVIAVSLLATFVLWQSGFGWVRMLGSDRPGWRLLQALLPAVLLLPLIPSLIGVSIDASGLIPPLGRRLLVLISNMSLVGLIAYWAVRRVARDQAALIATLEALQASEAQHRSILDTVPDAMVVIDGHARITQFSAAAETLWGYRAEDVLGRDFRILSPRDKFGENTAKLAEYIRDESDVTGRTIPAIGESVDGRRFPLAVRVGLTRVEGKLLVTMFARDLSNQLAAEERMSELSAELSHVSRLSAMGELAADMAHELNQPLSATTNFLAAARLLIERGENIDRVTELLGMANEQALRAGEIIRRLRAFTARGEVEMRPESVEQTVRDAVELVLVGTGQFDIRIAYGFDHDARWMFADRIQVQQVLVNILRNAVEALRNAGAVSRLIELRCRRVSGYMVEIEISDTGPGLPEAVLKQIFSRFVTTKHDRGGMGIGLSISKRIIEAHGGEFKAENRPEGGASFRFTVPAVEEEAGA